MADQILDSIRTNSTTGIAESINVSLDGPVESYQASAQNSSSYEKRHMRSNATKTNTLSRYSISQNGHHSPSGQHKDKVNAQKRLIKLQNDEFKIKNRVNLLEIEQKRMIKKVEETRSRAEKMKTIKEVNEQNYMDRLRR